MRHALAVLAAFLLSPPTWASERAAPPTLEAGVRVRLTAARSIHLPGLADIGEGRLEVSGGRIVERDSRRVLLEAPDGSILFVPLSEERVQGRLVAVERDAVVLALSKGSMIARVPRAAIATVEVAAGRSSRAGHALLGLFVGAGVGAGIGALTGTTCGPSDWLCSPGFNAIALGILVAPIGLVGGAAMPVQRWRRVDELSVRLHVVPTRRGAAVAVAVSF